MRSVNIVRKGGITRITIKHEDFNLTETARRLRQ